MNHKSWFYPDSDRLATLAADSADKLIDHWWFLEYRPEGRRKGSFGWIACRTALLRYDERADRSYYAHPWERVMSMSLDQFRAGTVDADGYYGGLSPKTNSRLFTVANFGEQWLSIGFYIVTAAPDSGIDPLEYPIAHAVASMPAFAQRVRFRNAKVVRLKHLAVPLAYLRAGVKVRRIEQGGTTRALILGFPLPEENGMENELCIGATDEEPAVLAQLEHFLGSFRRIYDDYVAPSIGKPTMVTPFPDHSMRTAEDWLALDPANLPKAVHSVAKEDLEAAMQAAVARGGATLRD